MRKTKAIKLMVCFLLAVIFIVGVVIHFHNKNNYKGNNPEKYMACIALKGFEFMIPNKYMAMFDSGMGLMYWNHDHFDMMIDVVEGDYEEDVSAVIAQINDIMYNELDVVKPYSEFSINGRRYVYMLYYEAGIPTIHGYSRADDEHMFEIMILCNEMAMITPQTDEEIQKNCEELVLIADSIISTSNATDKSDSPSGEVYIGSESYENLYSEVELNLSEKFIAQDTVQGVSAKAKAIYNVKQNFYCTGAKSKGDVQYLKLYSDYNGTSISVYLSERYDMEYNVKTEIEEGCTQWGDENSYVAESTVEDKTFYYYTYLAEYVEENRQVKEYNFVAMTDLGEGYVYVVECRGPSEDITDSNYYKDFFEVELLKAQ